MPTYRIEGKRVRTDKPLTDAEIDEIGAQIRGTPAPVAAPVAASATQQSGVPVGRMAVGGDVGPAMALLSPEQKRSALELGAQVAALGAGGVIGAGVRGVSALLPRAAPYLEPLATAIETGGFRSGLPTTAPRAAQLGMRATGGAIAGAGGAAVVNPEDAGYGAMVGAAVPVVGAPLLARGASAIGAGIDRLAGVSPMVRAGRMARATAGDQLNALRTAMQAQPDRPAAELAADLKLPLFQALVQKAENVDPMLTNRLLREREGEDLLNSLRRVSGGATQTEMRAGRGEAQKALTAVTTPMRERALAAAGVVGRAAPEDVAELKAIGLKPLKTDMIVSELRDKLKTSDVATNREANAAMSRVVDLLEQWTTKNGVIKPEDLYNIRKNAVSGVIRDLNPSMDEKAQRKFAAQVMGEIKPLIDNAIEEAGGGGKFGKQWTAYLKTFEEGKSGISRKELSAQLTDLFQNNKSAFEKIVRGDDPAAVEAILGPGKYDIAQELVSEMPTLRKAAESIRVGEKIGEQAKMGRASLTEQQSRDRLYKRFPFFTRASTAINEVAKALEAKTRDKTMDVLIDAAKSGRKMEQVLNALPADERIKVLKVLKTPADWNKWASGVATSYAGSQAAEPRNRLAPPPQNALAQ